MINRWFQEQILAYLDPDNAKALARLDSKSLEEEFQTVVQLLVDAPDDIRIDDGVAPTETLVEQISDRVTSTVINLFAPVLAKIESKLSRSDNETLSTEELLPAITRSDANVPIKRVVKHQGFEIGITHEKDAIRFPYSLPLSAGYGHIRRSYGAAEDKKAIDVYWGGDESATDVYRVRQLNPDTGFVAEHDYFMGFGGEDAPKAIRELYLRHLGQKRFGGLEKVDPFELTQFSFAADEDAREDSAGKNWVKDKRVEGGGYYRRSRNKKSITNLTQKINPKEIKLASGKGAEGRGGGDDGEYWHIQHKGKRVGNVYVNVIDEEPWGKHASLSIHINQEHRGKGIGSATYQKASEASQHSKIYLHMRKSNIASQKAASNAGFSVIEHPKDRQLTMVLDKNATRKDTVASTDNETLLIDWDNLRYDSPNQDDWDDSDYIIDHTMQQSGKVFNRWLSKIQDWVSEQGSLENARDRIHELYQHLDGKQLTQVLEQGMALADLSGRLAVVTESAENEEEADAGAEEESQNRDAPMERG